MEKFIVPLAASLLLNVVTTGVSNAHASLEKSEAPAGYYKAVISIPHGCGEQSTHTVRIELPEGFISAKPMPKAGWEIEVEKGNYAKTYMNHGTEIKSGPKAITWKGGDLPTDFYDEFVISGKIDGVEPGSVLAFPTTQLCKDGSVVWNEIAKDDEDPHALKHPAPLLKIAASQDAGHGHDHASHAAIKVGDIELTGAFTRATLEGQPVGGGFLVIENKGTEADRLLAASSPLTPVVQIHEMKMEGDVMKMAELKEGLEIPAGSKVELKPGGYHLMFMDLKAGIKEGDVIKVKLVFEKAGEVEVDMPAQAAGSKGMEHQHGQMNHKDQMNMHGMDDAQQIEHLMKAQFDKPEAPLSVSPVVVQGEFGIGGWAQGEAGGYALLKKVHDQWTIHLCTGGAVKEAANLIKMGIAEADAQTLAANLGAELAKLDPALVKQLDSFEGTVMIQGGAHGQGG